MEKTIRLLAAAGVLMLLAGALFALIRQWVYAALIWAGALGCLAAALNFRGKAKDAHQHEEEQVSSPQALSANQRPDAADAAL